MKYILLLITCLMSSCAYYAGWDYGYTHLHSIPYRSTYSYQPRYHLTYQNTYRTVYEPINCRNGYNQYEALKIYPNRDGRPFNLKYDHFY